MLPCLNSPFLEIDIDKNKTYLPPKERDLSKDEGRQRNINHIKSTIKVCKCYSRNSCLNLFKLFKFLHGVCVGY